MALKNICDGRLHNAIELECNVCGKKGKENDVNYILPLIYFLNRDDHAFIIRIFKPRFICEDCRRKEWLEKFHGLISKGIIRINKKRISNSKKRNRVDINWIAYFEETKENSKKAQEINEILYEIKVLSFRPARYNAVCVQNGYLAYFVSRKYIAGYKKALRAK